MTDGNTANFGSIVMTSPQILSLATAVPPSGAKDLYFVPVEVGAYALECTRPFHAAFGMTGTITID